MAAARRYEFIDPDTVRAKLAQGVMKGQTTLIAAAMLEGHTPLTVAEIAALIEPKLQTKQDPQRVVGFYISTWKRANMVREAASLTQPPAEDAARLAAIENAPHAPAIEPFRLEELDAEVSLTPTLEHSPEEVKDALTGVVDNTEAMREDLAKATTLRDAICAVIRFKPGVNNDQIVNLLISFWRNNTARKQVNDGLLKLAKKDEIRRHEGGGFYIVE